MAQIVLKTISPILYSVFLVPVTITTVIVPVLIEASPLSLNRFIFVGFPEMLATLAIVGTIGFWIGSKLIIGLEKPSNATVLDHLRQSSLLYLITAGALLYAFRNGDPKLKGDVAAISIATISVWATIINGVYLILHNRQASANSN